MAADMEEERNLVAAPQPAPAPWSFYDQLTPDEILLRCVRGGKVVRAKVLAYERAHKKRDAIILPLVNWNS